jgi:hypothetical protein
VKRFASISALLALAVTPSACGGVGHERAVQGGYVPPPLSAPQSTASARATATPASSTVSATSRSSWDTPGTASWEAAQFVTAKKGYAWDQPEGIGGWAIKAKPYCTPSYWASLDRRVQSAEAGQAAGQGDSGDSAFWQQVQSEKETLFIDVTDADVITEAGSTPTTEWVRVTYNTTDVTARNPDPSPQYDGQEDVIMSKAGSQWLVTGEGNAAGEG